MKPRSIPLLARAVLAAIMALPALLVISQASPVAASPPTREPLPAGPFTLTGVCSFDVQVTVPVNSEYLTTFYNRNGDVTMQLVTGALRPTLTNLSTGYSTTVNIPGPAHTEFNPDGSGQLIGTGPWLQWGEVNDLLSWPSLALVHGNYRIDFDSNGEFTGGSSHGNVTDMCAALEP
jgi:hypothetical protein